MSKFTFFQCDSKRRGPEELSMVWQNPTALTIAILTWGVTAAFYPLVGMTIFAGLLVLVLILVFSTTGLLPQVFLTTLGLLLVGYASCGRGFAYIGVRPVFIGECVLLLGAVVALASCDIRLALRSPVAKLFVVFAAWGGLCTLPYVRLYGVDSFRDGVVWGYGAFALFVSVALIHTNAINRIPEYFARFLPWVLCWIPFAMLISAVAKEILPTLPGTEIPIVSLKVGDAAVHLAGIGVFLLLGLHSVQNVQHRKSLRIPESLLWLVWLAGVLMVSTGRSALLSLLISLFVVWIAKPTSRRWLKLVLLAFIVGGGLTLIGLELDVNRSRTYGPRQIVSNVTSIFSEAQAERVGLSGTRQWRLNWWQDIVGYTVFGDFFWMGKGYGVNLANDDDYQVSRNESLRSPHNIHMTILARSGVPGVMLWIALQFVFATSLLAAYFEARRLGDERWARLDLWVLAYWTAFMVNGTFDVFLEGPQGGIWFWSLFGYGISILEAQRSHFRISLMSH